MKITKLAIVFVMVAICLMLPTDIKLNNLIAIENKRLQYDQSLESAVDDAVLKLIDMADIGETTYGLNKEACVDQFFNSLYANFGVIDSTVGKNRLKSYVPVLVVTDNDGYYISFVDTYKDSTDTPLYTRVWTDKKPYYYEEGNLIFVFTLGDIIKVYDTDNNEISEGYYEDLKERFSDVYLFQDKDIFDQVKRNAIVGCIQEDMKYYINSYNKIAENFGITYDFYLPAVDENDWKRTIDSISLFVVFQGYPYGYGTNEVFNRYAYAGARVKKADMYFISERDGTKVYHRSDCDEITNYNNPVYSKKECALQGAYPCEKCKP